MVVAVCPIVLAASVACVWPRSLASVAKNVTIRTTAMVKLTLIVDSLIFSLANPCSSNPCGANGQCIQSSGGFYCECLVGHFGNRCEREYCIRERVLSAWNVNSARYQALFARLILARMEVHVKPARMVFSFANVHPIIKVNAVNFVCVPNGDRRLAA